MINFFVRASAALVVTACISSGCLIRNEHKQQPHHNQHAGFCRLSLNQGLPLEEPFYANRL